MAVLFTALMMKMLSDGIMEGMMNKLLKPRIIIPFVLVSILSPLVFLYHKPILVTILGMSLLVVLVVVFAALFIVFAVSVIYLIECVYKNEWLDAKGAFGYIRQLKNDIKDLF